MRTLQSYLLTQIGRVVVQQSDRDAYGRTLDNASQLYMYLLFEQTIFKNDGIDSILSALEAQQKEMDELRQSAKTFTDSLKLFDTADFYVTQDEGSQTNTEIDYIIDYCQQYLTLKTSMWAEIKDMQTFIREELSKPFIIQENIQEVIDRASQINERLANVQFGLDAIQRKTQQYLEENLSINQEANRVIEFGDPIVFSLQQNVNAETGDELEMDDLSIGEHGQVTFSDVKFLVFVYKRMFREQQLRQIRINERMYYSAVKERVHLLEEAIEKDNVDYAPQPIRAAPDQLSIIPTQNDEFVSVLKTDVDKASFTKISKDAIATLFDLVHNPFNNLLELAQRLTRQIVSDIGDFYEMRTIAVQPKLFV